MQPEVLLETLKSDGPRRVAVAAAQDSHVLDCMAEAYRAGIALPVLVGDIERIDAIARAGNTDISSFEIIEADSDKAAAAIAVSLIVSGRADVLMKGCLQTSTLLRAVLDKDKGLRTGATLSHVGAVYAHTLGRTLFLTDCGMVPYPDLEAKAALIANAVPVARSMGVGTPKVAVLAAVETVNPKMPPTTDAALLAMMNRRGQIKDCVVDGPLSVDLALSADAVAHKGVDSPVAGQADILLFPNIEMGNGVVKTFTVAAGAVLGGIIVGAKAPIVMTSRSDSAQSKLYSIACAIHYSKHKR